MVDGEGHVISATHTNNPANLITPEGKDPLALYADGNLELMTNHNDYTSLPPAYNRIGAGYLNQDVPS